MEPAPTTSMNTHSLPAPALPPDCPSGHTTTNAGRVIINQMEIWQLQNCGHKLSRCPTRRAIRPVSGWSPFCGTWWMVVVPGSSLELSANPPTTTRPHQVKATRFERLPPTTRIIISTGAAIRGDRKRRREEERIHVHRNHNSGSESGNYAGIYGLCFEFNFVAEKTLNAILNVLQTHHIGWW